MFHRIIIGVDGGPGGGDAVALARSLAEPDSDLVVTCVGVVDAQLSRSVNPDHEAQVVESARQIAVEAAEGRPDLRAATVVEPSVAEGLHAAAEREGADLIVVGSCRRGVVGRLLAGDDARSVARDAPCAVAIAPVGFADDPRPLQRIGAGDDGAPEAATAVKVAGELARRAGGRAEVLQVVSVPTWTGPDPGVVRSTLDDQRAEARRRLQSLPDVDGEVHLGSPASSLEAFSEHLDLLTVGSRHHGPIGRVLLGSVADGLTHRAHCALLVVPPVGERVGATRG